MSHTARVGVVHCLLKLLMFVPRSFSAFDLLRRRGAALFPDINRLTLDMLSASPPSPSSPPSSLLHFSRPCPHSSILRDPVRLCTVIWFVSLAFSGWSILIWASTNGCFGHCTQEPQQHQKPSHPPNATSVIPPSHIPFPISCHPFSTTTLPLPLPPTVIFQPILHHLPAIEKGT